MLVEGKNVWRIAHSDRVAVIIDGAAYFEAFIAAIERARHSVLILSWDIDSQTDLRPPGHLRLIDELEKISRKRVETYVLNWDYAPIYAFEREQVPRLRFRSRSHPNLHFMLDAHHPYCASHHQKVVVIDDAIAFCGGIDLTTHRWDTPEHMPGDPRRLDAIGRIYEPFHDVQIAVDGEAARTLGELARERWYRATGERIAPPPSGGDPWPDLPIDLEDVAVGIARTEPAYEGRPAIREVQQAFLDSIACAEHTIYAETQYLSSSLIRDAIKKRLSLPDGPEIILVTPRRCCGWMEKQTIGVITTALVRELRESDQHGRLRVLSPHIDDEDVFVHSKVMIVDDRLLRVGSANLSNRSLGVDTECDLLIESDDPRVRADILRVRDRLLAEHLGTNPETIEAEIEKTGSLARAIATFEDGERGLVRADLDEAEDLLIPAEIADPRAPIDPDLLVRAVVPKLHPRAARARLLRFCAALAALVALALAWRFTPLADVIALDRLIARGQDLATSPLAPLIVVLVYAVGTTLMVPVNLLLIATGVIFGPAWGALYAMIGSLAGAATGYAVGRTIGTDTVHAIIGRKVHRIASLLHRRGLIAFTTVRLVPIASFGLVNMLGGAMRIRFIQFMIGTLIGMAPGIAITVLLGGELADLFAS